MSRPMTPISGTLGSITGGDTSTVDHAHEAPEYAGTGDAGRDDPRSNLQRSGSQMSQSATYVPSRGNTLKKKASLHKTGSLKRSGSRRSSVAGSVRSMKLGEKDKYEPEEYNSAFYCPVPTSSSPTELLANRFQAWRRVLKDLINYFRDLHKSHEVRSKALLSASNVINNTGMPSDFLTSGGISDTSKILQEFHKQAINEANKARDLENEVIMQLTGLRSDLSQKIKEIKSLSGDFKNSVHKEQDGTRKAVNAFQEALGVVDRDAEAAAGKGDPFLMKLGVERQLERQIEEENYLHRAFLNLEASGRELESIVVGEIQKAYTVLAGIMKRDADNSYEAAEKMREGPLAMARDHEWDAFVTGNASMVDPRQPLRQVKSITYEGKDHPAAIEVKSGMLERKSKYLKNYTPGWYILSPTHLHEFKSADQIPFQAPVMSLYLPEQKLGSHSEPGSSSHKFMIKGRQTGSMHRGHTWIFRAETHDTMMAWFSDIRELTEKRGEARNEFVRRTHARSITGSSQRAASVGSSESQMDEDEADRVAFSGEQSVRGVPLDQTHDGPYGAGGTVGSGIIGDDNRSEAGWRPPQRPQPGGRFPSEVNVTRGLQAPLSPSSGDSGDEHDREAIAAASALPGSTIPFVAATSTKPPTDHQQSSRTGPTGHDAYLGNTAVGPSTYAAERGIDPTIHSTNTGAGYTAGEHPRVTANPIGAAEVAPDTQSQYHEWVGTAGAGLAGIGAGALGATAVQRQREQRQAPENAEQEMSTRNPAIPAAGHSSAPMITDVAVPAPTQNQVHGIDEPNRITASVYQQATVPSNTTGASQAQQTNTFQPSTVNGSLIGGTDIRTGAAVGSDLHNSNARAEPSDVYNTAASSNTGTTGTTGTRGNTETSNTTGTTGVLGSTTRPDAVSMRSINTISDLHIPGEFPKSATTPPRSAM